MAHAKKVLCWYTHDRNKGKTQIPLSLVYSSLRSSREIRDYKEVSDYDE